jgi:hypothetical protein
MFEITRSWFDVIEIPNFSTSSLIFLAASKTLRIHLADLYFVFSGDSRGGEKG